MNSTSIYTSPYRCSYQKAALRTTCDLRFSNEMHSFASTSFSLFFLLKCLSRSEVHNRFGDFMGELQEIQKTRKRLKNYKNDTIFSFGFWFNRYGMGFELKSKKQKCSSEILPGVIKHYFARNRWKYQERTYRREILKKVCFKNWLHACSLNLLHILQFIIISKFQKEKRQKIRDCFDLKQFLGWFQLNTNKIVAKEQRAIFVIGNAVNDKKEKRKLFLTIRKLYSERPKCLKISTKSKGWRFYKHFLSTNFMHALSRANILTPNFETVAIGCKANFVFCRFQ